MGGQEMRILIEMERMRDLGFESVLAARRGSDILPEAERRGIRAHAIPMTSRLDPVSMAMLWRLMRREAIDIVNAHGSRDAWLAFPVARLLGIRTVRARHIANPIRQHAMGRLIYGALCDRIVTTSESIRAGLIERGVDAGKIVSIPTGIDVARFASARRDGRVRRELGIPESAPLFGMISLLRGEKGPDVFLDACDRLLTGNEHAWCVLVGEGWMRPQLEAQLATLRFRERIVLAGFRKDIPEVLAELDVSVLSTRTPEGVPQVILQSHAASVPVVTTSVAGIGEVAQEGNTAFTVPPNDPPALAKAMRRALDEPDTARHQAANGHALVVGNYSLEAMLKRMADFYRALMAQERT
ncbi:MAG: glycosyltransferase [Pseudomonadota bacterium]